jgi:hypothetical protein
MAIVARLRFTDNFISTNQNIGPPNYTTDGNGLFPWVDANNVATTQAGIDSGFSVARLDSSFLLEPSHWIQATLNASIDVVDYVCDLSVSQDISGAGYYFRVADTYISVGSYSAGEIQRFTRTSSAGEVYLFSINVVSVDHDSQVANIDLSVYIDDVLTLSANNGGEYNIGYRAGFLIYPDTANAVRFGWKSLTIGDWVDDVIPSVTSVNDPLNSARSNETFVITGENLDSVLSVSVRTLSGLHSTDLIISKKTPTLIQLRAWDIHDTGLPYGEIVLVLQYLSQEEVTHNFTLQETTGTQYVIGQAIDDVNGLAQSTTYSADGDIWDMPLRPNNAGYTAALYADTNILFTPGPTSLQVFQYWNYTAASAVWDSGEVTLSGTNDPGIGIVDKPVMPSIWANDGVRLTPSDAKKETGWVAELPAAEHENYIENRQDTYIAHLNERGFPEWDTVTDYFRNAYCYFVDNVYIALIGNTGRAPDLSPQHWARWDYSFEPKGLIKMWFGGSVVPVGWALCDGNGTIDLRNRFIKSANTTGSDAGLIHGVFEYTASNNVPGHDHGSVTTEASTIFQGFTSSVSTHNHALNIEPPHTHTGTVEDRTLGLEHLPSHAHGYRQVLFPSAGGGGSGAVFNIELTSSTTGLGTTHTHTLSIGDAGEHQHYGGTGSPLPTETDRHYHGVATSEPHAHTMWNNIQHSHNVAYSLPQYITVVYIQKV